MKHRVLSFILVLMSISAVWANNQVSFTASAPSTAIQNQPFQLTFSVNAKGSNFKAPEMNDFEVLAGPFSSTSSSYQIINGQATSSVSVSYTYTLQADKTGKFTVLPASIVVGGKKYTSNGVSIKVLPADKSSSANSNGGSNGQQVNNNNNENEASGQGITKKNLFIRTIVSRVNAYEQQAILVTYKLYTLVDVIQCQNQEMPDFHGFMQQDLDQDQNQNKQFSYENLNGRNYGTVVLYQVLLFPQHSGDITIDKAKFVAVVRQHNRSQGNSIFDDFFDSYTNVNKTLISPAVKIHVNALPGNKPAGFTGAVGHFTLNSSISAKQIKANEAVTMKVVISGNGNMKMIQNPVIQFPNGFDQYDPKITNDFKNTTAGVSGTKTIEYMVIPRHDGDFVIPPTSFTYFDIQDKTFKTLKTQAFHLKVLKGEGSSSDDSNVVTNYVNKENIKQLGKDIRFIETGDIVPEEPQVPIIGTFLSWILYLVPLILTIIIFFIFKKKTEEMANIQFMKNKRANKVARKRLNLAQKLLSEGKKDQFYDEVLKAVWNYLSDKFSISAANLTRETVQVEFEKRSLDADLLKQFIDILNTCEFARYAPNSGQEEMGNLYDETIEAISQLENKIKL